MLEQFRRAVEARGVDSFWVSRAAGRLRGRPERIAQALLAVFVKGVIGNRGVVLREVASGVGFVDVGILLSRIMHLVELKVIRGSLKGASQLRQYMRTEGRRRGWLVVMDARRRDRRTPIQTRLATPGGTIDTIVVEINPEAPSKQ
jgi:hypothetical protein